MTTRPWSEIRHSHRYLDGLRPIVKILGVTQHEVHKDIEVINHEVVGWRPIRNTQTERRNSNA